MTVPNSPIHGWAQVLFFLIHIPNGESELICPDVGYLDSPANLTCISPSNVTSHGYTTSQGETAAFCAVSGSPCTPIGDFRASAINQTHSLLTIPAVQPEHAGEWKCQTSSCNLIVVKLPNCSLRRRDDATGPDLKAGVSLGVNIMGYYCSQLTQLNISTGDSVTVYPHDITDKTVSINVNKSDSNIEVELTFACGDHRWNISCITDNNDGRSIHTLPDSRSTSPPKQEEEDERRGANLLLLGIGIGSGVTLLMFGLCLGIAVLFRRRALVLQVSEVQPDIAMQLSEGADPPTRGNESGTDESHPAETPQSNYSDLEERRDGASHQYEQMRVYHEIGTVS